MRRAFRPVVAGLAAALAALAPAAAQEPFVGLDLLWVRPVSEPGAPRHCARLLVLNLPRDWMVGDAAVAIFAEDDAAVVVRPLIEALIPEVAAVLEVPSRPVDECLVRPADPVAEVLGAVHALRVDASAGLVVAVGVGAMGAAVLAAMREDLALRYLGADGPRLAAAMAIGGDGPAAFAMGVPPEGQAWHARAPLLCSALASATSQVQLGACLAGLGINRPMAGTVRRMRF